MKRRNIHIGTIAPRQTEMIRNMNFIVKEENLNRMHKQDNRILYKRHNDERRYKDYKPTNITKQN